MDQLIDWIPVVPASLDVPSALHETASTRYILSVKRKVSLERGVESCIFGHREYAAVFVNFFFDNKAARQGESRSIKLSTNCVDADQ